MSIPCETCSCRDDCMVYLDEMDLCASRDYCMYEKDEEFEE